MKQSLSLMVLALGMYSANVAAQATQQNGQSTQITEFRHEEKDGYVWYKLKQGNLFGARDSEGNNIIPIKYNEVSYHNDWYNLIYQIHYFSVKSGEYEGAYTRQGTQVVSPEKHYKSVILYGEGGKICWIAKKDRNGKQIVLDARGNEIFSVDCNHIYMTSAFDNSDVVKHTNVCYFSIERNNKKGICDLNGNIICPPEYNSCWLKDYGKTLQRGNDLDSISKEPTNYSDNTRYDYSPYEDLYYKCIPSSSNKSSNSSSSNK